MPGVRRAIVVSVLASLVPTPRPAFAQAAFEDLALRINLEDHVRIEDRSGGETTGRVIGLTPDEIAIETGAGERHFVRSTVRDVAVRSHPLRKGALIGAAAVAVLGTATMCAHGDEHCVLIGTFGAAPIGAGVGLAIGALVPGMRPVYHAPAGGPPALPRAAAGTGFFSDLALRANIDDEVQIEDRSGVRITGRLTGLTADGITVRTDAGEKEFARESVRRIAVRRRPLRLGVLIGTGTGAAAGALAACSGPDREECADAWIITGALGAGLGLAAGALMHTTATVYPGPDSQTFVVPVVSRDVLGVAFGRRW
jgi:hypothetical protein